MIKSNRFGLFTIYFFLFGFRVHRSLSVLFLIKKKDPLSCFFVLFLFITVLSLHLQDQFCLFKFFPVCSP